MFGFDKIKNEKVSDNEKPLFDFINDLENVSNAYMFKKIRFQIG